MKYYYGLAGAALFTLGVVAQADTLVPLVFDPLPLGSIKPQGWLQDQLQLEADGLAGHEHDFYDWVAHSSWLGGTMEYSSLNEGFPYWFNGIVPLAYGLDDARLKAQVDVSVRYIIDNQQSDGWIGPEVGNARNFWARYPTFLGLMNLVDANPAEYESYVVPAMQRFVVLMHSMLANDYTGYIYHQGDKIGAGDVTWGQVRVQDMMISLMWMYENHPANNSQILMDNLEMLYAKSINWAAWYNNVTFIKENLYYVPGTGSADPNFNHLYSFEHGVNAGQGLKAPAVYRRFTHNESMLATARLGVDLTFNYHGAASGTILADERIDGLDPYYGSELCTAVETMYSLSYLYQAIGDNDLADRCEVAAFNALPAMLTPDWWAHQYMEQPNQPYAIDLPNSPFFDVNNWGQTFGLEPNYPCCTVNHPQGYPKFLAATFNRVGTDGLAHVLLSPAVATTTVNGGKVTVSAVTAYPFDMDIQYTITAANAFTFYVRVPAWADASTTHVTLGSAKATTVSPDAQTGLHAISIPAGTSYVSYKLGATVVAQPRANDTVSMFYGPVLYALDIGSANTSTIPKAYNNESYYPAGYAPPQSRDYQIFNTTEWNVAIDPSTIAFRNALHAGRNELGTAALANPLYAPGAPPTSMTALACQIDWPLFRGSVPGSPPVGAARKCLGGTFNVTLRPYAAQKLHMAELPTMSLK